MVYTSTWSHVEVWREKHIHEIWNEFSALDFKVCLKRCRWKNNLSFCEMSRLVTCHSLLLCLYNIVFHDIVFYIRRFDIIVKQFYVNWFFYVIFCEMCSDLLGHRICASHKRTNLSFLHDGEIQTFWPFRQNFKMFISGHPLCLSENEGSRRGEGVRVSGYTG